MRRVFNQKKRGKENQAKLEQEQDHDQEDVKVVCATQLGELLPVKKAKVKNQRN